MKYKDYKVYKDLQESNLKSWWEKENRDKNHSIENEGIWYQIRKQKPTTKKDVINYLKKLLK